MPSPEIVYGGLERLMNALKENGPEAKALIRHIGNQYKELSAANPDMLIYRHPAEDLDAIKKQYGVDIAGVIRPYDSHYIAQHPKGRAELRMIKGRDVEDSSYAGLAQALNPNSTYGVVNSAGLEQSSGAGSAIYPAIFDYLRNHGNLLNVSDTTVTPINAWRKPWANTLGAMLRHKQNTVVPHPLSLLDTHITPTDYLASDYDSQVGHTLVNGLLGMNKHIKTYLDYFRNLDPGGSELADMWGTTPEAVGALDNYRPDYGYYGVDNPTITARKLQAAGVPSVGETSLRKANVINNIIEGSDITPSMLHHLERKCGGLVQAQRHYMRYQK